ncbi:hypothetical protein P3102_34160 [Amycolatopsis sp. QT-25]|uniref:hypothetical protein n=1 Tax=Amycolatopsis sp. QT-25 TaxID=3034022 RepID=UPI0023EC791C|nr:hypothetical protein [Amycolatopsis sp. QT-25]WET79024.1 hypothetical protein P3102_34160 [Amycolatopsis sp. QT-25]
MTSPTTTKWIRRAGLAAGTAALVFSALPASTATGHTQPPGTTGQARTTAGPACTIEVPETQPVVFTPAVQQTQATVTTKATYKLTDCIKDDGSPATHRTGVLTFSGSALADCTRAEAIEGTATITWRGINGALLGTSTITPIIDSVDENSTAESLIAGRITKGRMLGLYVGVVFFTNDLSRCSTDGVEKVWGTGRVFFPDQPAT